MPMPKARKKVEPSPLEIELIGLIEEYEVKRANGVYDDDLDSSIVHMLKHEMPHTYYIRNGIRYRFEDQDLIRDTNWQRYRLCGGDRAATLARRAEAKRQLRMQARQRREVAA